MKKKIFVLTLLFYVVCFVRADIQAENNETFSGFQVTDKGAWCWFADPRALHYENNDGTIKSSYIGYIDVHGNIKATQHDFITGITSEVLVRSWFQPDDHNNPTFLVLPDERIMIFYSRHTDERCFYYRISQKPGDITTFGQEKRLDTNHNTTYPSAYILSDDPDHIYLCWRGINWHPTIARLTMPDVNDNVSFNWGPYQMVSYSGSGSRPYAKYTSNGKDRIYMTFTTTHPDNQSVNYVYFSYIDINTRQLIDVKENVISTIASGPHSINSNSTYTNAYPNVVVDNSPYRNWIWEVSMDSDQVPVIAMVRISEDKNTHHYYHAKWTGTEWKRTFLANGGGPFHQSPNIERCYSGGMALDPANPDIVYCSVPVTGNFGSVYELYKYTVGTNGSVTAESVTKNSKKNNVRPFMLPFSENTPLRLTWMHGDYYDWIVSSQRPDGYPTAIHSDFELPVTEIDLANGLLVHEDFSGDETGTAYTENGLLVTSQTTNTTIEVPESNAFTISLNLHINNATYFGDILKVGTITYALGTGTNPKPFTMIGDVKFDSNNVLGNSDVWKNHSRGTGGHWYPAERFKFFNLSVTYENGILTTFVNGLIDQYIEEDGLTLGDVIIGGFDGWVEDCRIYNRALSQDEIKRFTALLMEMLNVRELESLNIPDHIYTDIVLKSATSAGTPISWTSSNTQIISNSGLVNLPQTETEVILTASVDGIPKEFPVSVMPRNIDFNKLAIYDFEEGDKYVNNGITYVTDKSGNNNDAVIYGNAQINGALDLTANTNAGFSTNGYAMAPNGIIDGLRSYSFVAKVNPVRLNNLPRIYDFGSGAPNSVFGRASALTAGYKYNGGTTVLINSSQALPLSTETFLAFTFNAKTKSTRIYVNNEITATSTAITREPYELSMIAENTRNYIGRSQWQNADNVDFCGKIDFLYIFDIALTHEELLQMQLVSGTVPAPEILPLSIHPNPSKRNGKIWIDYDFSSEEKAGLKVEVLNSWGSVVQKLSPTSFPIAVNEISDRGLYFLRITDGKNGVRVGKVIVEM